MNETLEEVFCEHHMPSILVLSPTGQLLWHKQALNKIMSFEGERFLFKPIFVQLYNNLATKWLLMLGPLQFIFSWSIHLLYLILYDYDRTDIVEYHSACHQFLSFHRLPEPRFPFYKMQLLHLNLDPQRGLSPYLKLDPKRFDTLYSTILGKD